MATNIEIKARVGNLSLLRERAERLSQKPAELLLQEDSFFCVPQGRLKLRILGPARGELIYYEREDLAGPKSSHYLLFRTSDPAALRALLEASLGLLGVVRKQRWLFMVGSTRIHLDDVEGLGAFMELEVVLQPGQSVAEGQAIAADLMQQLGIKPGDLVAGAYLDLLRDNGASTHKGGHA
jgi:predicted adenylyl cyclase CyaB